MHFKTEWIVRRMALREPSITFSLPKFIRVTLRQPTAAEAERFTQWTAFCEASTERTPTSAVVVDAFTALAAHELPKGTAPERIRTPSTGWRVPETARLPEAFRSFVQQVLKDLHDGAMRTVHVIRWRHHVSGEHSLGVGASSWSFDAQTWNPLPWDTRVMGLELHALTYLDEQQRTEVEGLVSAGLSEPLGHGLWREAWPHRASDTRSAIVIGIAALEVGLKECIAELVPAAEWLVERSPSPPVVMMLREYLPKLPARQRIADQVKAPPDALLKTLEKGVHLRNQIAHVGDTVPDYDTVEEILRAVKDVLWLLDYYRGYAWALEHLSPTTRTTLGVAGVDRRV
jgi:hypothetical protein